MVKQRLFYRDDEEGLRTKKESPADRWFVYMVRCADDSLYTGIAKDVARRCQQHNAGIASRYTRSRLPVVLVYEDRQRSKSLALKREASLKALSRRQKLALVTLRVLSFVGVEPGLPKNSAAASGPMRGL